MKKAKQFISKILACIMIYSNISTVHATDLSIPVTDFSYQESLSTIEEAEEYVKNSAVGYISTFLGLSSIGYVSTLLTENEKFYLGHGYYTYSFEKEQLVCNEIITFPIIQNEEIVLQLKVSKEDETWTTTATAQYVDMLNEYISVDENPFIVYYEDCGYLLEENQLICLDSVVEEEQLQYEMIEEFLKETVGYSVNIINSENDMIDLGYVENPVPNMKTRLAGFAVNTNTYKLLEIANCTVDQYGPDGEVANLCWASTALTIIRYRSSGYRELRPWEVADALNISYDAGAYQGDVYNALKHYLNTAELDKYAAVSRSASSFTEIQHNINNCFPIAMGGYHYFLNWLKDAGHMVTIIGYDSNNIIYWDSFDLEIKVTSYIQNKTYFESQDIKYKWENSVLIPL